MRRSGVVFWALFLFCSLPVLCLGDAGVIIPKNIKNKPDPSILSLDQMSVWVRVDGQYARVRALQIFRNHIKTDVEGRYIFTLPEGSQVSDFAIWEDGVRIPGVVIERKRAREIYEELTYMKIDPGLMETTEEELRNVFSVEIYPIPAFGTKRVEIEYTANLEVTSLQSRFLFPLKPNLYGRQECADFKLELEFDSEFPVRNFRQIGEAMPLKVLSSSATQVQAEYAAQNIEFKEDFAFEYELDLSASLLSFAAFRNPEEVVDLGPFGGGEKYVDLDGYFAASAVYNLHGGDGERPPKDVVLLVDTSLSMQWDKLERSYEALLFFLRNLPAADRFALVTFNQEVQSFDTKLRPAGEENVAAALEFFRSGYLMGGTDIAGALETVGAFFDGQAEERERYVILITDGAPTGAEISYARIADRVRESNRGSRAKFMVFGIGGDTNTSLLQRIADDSGGHFVWASETEDLDFKLRTFLDKLGERIIAGLGILFGDMNNIDRVYPADDQRSYDRSMVTFIGRYKQAKKDEKITVSGSDGTGPVTLEKAVSLPETATEHDMLPRRWAKLRVDFLLQKIDMAEEGEDVEDMIREVVALAKRYKFVTPYTSFIAAPRALLRPRAIKPGDPVLRVRTDEAIVSVVATFPFGLTKPLHYIQDEDVWETRFLAPKWMRDGTYECTLLLTDKEGNLYEEDKSFVIDSKPPTLKVGIDKKLYRPGDEVVVTVNADSDTRNIQVRFGKLLPVEARYRTALGASLGTVRLPAELPAGTYTLLVTAVDFARNTTVVEKPIEVGVK